MCVGRCADPEGHRAHFEFMYCPRCRHYAVMRWLTCLKAWQCERCERYLSSVSSVEVVTEAPWVARAA